MRLVMLTTSTQGILRYSRWDALLIILALGQGALILALPAAPVIALGLWWNSNTIAHYFIHKPFFQAWFLNILFSIYLSLLLGIPQELWRDRHLTHHFGGNRPGRDNRLLLFEVAAVGALWGLLITLVPWFFLTVYLPGYLAGLTLCWLHGHYEHSRGTVSHHGLLYNLLFFNDGYHVEHHRHPEEHWTCLPTHVEAGVSVSRWPAVFRWLDVLSLEGLERLVLRSPWLQRQVLRCHERAFRRLLPQLPAVDRVGIVGGALYPRTLLILRRLLPEARFVVIDMSLDSIQLAQTRIEADVRFVHARFDPARVHKLDLLIFPLSFRGDREALYRQPSAPAVIVHDWFWRRRGLSTLVSLVLLKRLNLVKRRKPRVCWWSSCWPSFWCWRDGTSPGPGGLR
jgi:hypothetical protein